LPYKFGWNILLFFFVADFLRCPIVALTVNDEVVRLNLNFIQNSEMLKE